MLEPASMPPSICMLLQHVQSHQGSLACLLGGFAAAVAAGLYFRSFGTFREAYSLRDIINAATAAAAAGAAVESLPQGQLDNLSVPLAAAAAAQAVLRQTT
jgi:dolichol kinase